MNIRKSTDLTRLIVTVFVLSAGITVFAGEVDFPGTPAGKRAGEVVGLLNLGDEETAKKYFETEYAPEFLDAFPMS